MNVINSFSPVLPNLREWQAAAVGEAHRILIDEDKPHIYICAPTGTGKSRAIYEFCERLPVTGTHIIMVGMAQIVEQFKVSFIKNGCKPESSVFEVEVLETPTGKHIFIGTYQGLRAMADRRRATGETAPWKTGLLIFDEAHIGGSNSAGLTGDESDPEEQNSFQKIDSFFQPQKKVYVSATTQTANEALLGKKKDHFYRYKMSEAYADGVLHPVSLCEVHTGIRAKIERVEEAYGRNVERLEQLVSDDLADLAAQLKKSGVGVSEEAKTGLRGIIRHKHRSMIQLYARKHCGQQAIFYSPNIEAAKHAALDFNAYMNKIGSGSVRALAVHSQEPKFSDRIKDFEKGKITVLFVVGMLQEGFDMPMLALAFDCRFYRTWEPSRIARFIQKVGRLMRTPPEGMVKEPGLYYFARDITDFYKHSNLPDVPVLSEDDDEADIGLTPEDEEILKSSGAAGVAVVEREGDGGSDFDAPTDPDWAGADITVAEPVVEGVKFDAGFDPEPDDSDTPEIDMDNMTTKRVVTVTTPLYALRYVSGYKVKTRLIEFASLFGNSADEKKKELIALAKSGSDKYTQCESDPIKKSLGVALAKYCNPKEDTYDPEFEQEIRALRPDWFVKSVDAMKEELIKLAKAGAKKPNSYTKNAEEKKMAGALSKYIGRSSRSYDAEFSEKIHTLRPDWWECSVSRKKKDLITLAENGAPKPSGKNPQDKPLLTALQVYLNPKNATYDSEFAEKIRALRPDWFDSLAKNKSDLLNLAEKGLGRAKKKRAKNKSDLLNIAEKGLGRAEAEKVAKCPSGMISRCCSPNSDRYDSVFDSKIRALRPDWFVNSGDEKKKELIALAKSGGKRPAQSAKAVEEKKLAMALANYARTKSAVYDAHFDKEIRALRPDWFVNPADEKKKELLALAKSGGAKPKDKTRLGTALGTYARTKSSVYDAHFDEEIRTLRPDWFVNPADEKKKELFALANSGGAKPKDKTRLGAALGSYTRTKSSTYDTHFDKEIRALRPDWFKK